MMTTLNKETVPEVVQVPLNTETVPEVVQVPLDTETEVVQADKETVVSEEVVTVPLKVDEVTIEAVTADTTMEISGGGKKRGAKKESGSELKKVKKAKNAVDGEGFYTGEVSPEDLPCSQCWLNCLVCQRCHCVYHTNENFQCSKPCLFQHIAFDVVEFCSDCEQLQDEDCEEIECLVGESMYLFNERWGCDTRKQFYLLSSTYPSVC